MSKLSQKTLAENLLYDPLSGEFIWRRNIGSYAIKNCVAGRVGSDGYIVIALNKQNYLAHRLAFLYMEGYLPEYLIDHKNTCRTDNRWCNLRHATPQCNAQNQKVRKTNKSGFTGVAFNIASGKWLAYARVLKQRISLGSHDSVEDAALARITFEDQCPNWNCGNDTNRKALRALGYKI